MSLLRLNAGLLDVVRGVEIGFAGAETHHVLTLRLHLLKHGVNGKGGGRTDIECQVG